MVMDLASGGPMLEGLAGASTFAAVPRLARRLPSVLAETMAALHSVDPAPIRDRMDEVPQLAARDVTDFVAGIGASAELVGRDDLALVAQWLLAHPPPVAPDVVCHGDLHPFNLLVDAHQAVTLLDWSGGMLAPAAYDAAFTSLLLSVPPVVIPRPLAPTLRLVGSRLSRRFLRTYEASSGTEIDPDSLRWHQGVICLRSLAELAGWIAAGRFDEYRAHPWVICGPAFAQRLGALTGVAVRAR
jgi:aminoglycoside phosphotransferase (APT) family kinase protein